MDILYKNIKRLRTEKHLTQEELALKTGYTDRSSVAKVEKGEIDLTQSKILAFADALGVTPQYLMGYTEEDDSAEFPTFTTAQEAISFILEQPLVAQFGGYDLDEMSDQQKIDFANAIAEMIKVMGKPYKKE